MRTTLRSLTLCLASALALVSSAQYPYTIILQGTILDCYPGQTVHVQTEQGTLPVYDFYVPVDTGSCSWTASLPVETNPAHWRASTLCNGVIIGTLGTETFSFVLDTNQVSTILNCGLMDSDNDGFTDDLDNCPFTPGLIGWACDDGDPATLNDVIGANCVCAGQDSSQVIDCEGVPNGPNLPGTACTTFFGTPGTWGADCICVGDTNNTMFDCLGVENGPNMPGTACDDGDPGTLFSWWSADCVCTADTGGTYYDCAQVVNGPNLPGTPCVIPGTTIAGTWSADCVCIPDSTDPCQADFWVLQAYGQDSLPVPYELWVWNLSSGGSGIYSYTWDFGDGTTSTDPYPTHTYDGNGPYVLCLTLNDLNGCTSIHCDSISIDGDGMYNGMIGGAGDRQDGFTINVQNPAANGVQELGLDDVVLWPNPADDELNVAVNGTLRGAANFTVIDMNGRVVLNERHALNGRTQLRFALDGLESGLYTLRIDDGTRNLSNLRFVRMH